MFNDLTAYQPDLGLPPAEEVDPSWEEVVPEDQDMSLGKHPALDFTEESRKCPCPSSEGTKASAQVSSLWGQKHVSDMLVGLSAPKGLIMHYVQKKDTKGKGKAL